MSHDQSDESALYPHEQTVVTFFDLPCLAVRAADGAIYLALSDMCDAIGVDRSSQRRRINAHIQFAKGLRTFRVSTPGGLQNREFLHLQVMAAWLMTIGRPRTGDPERAAAVQARLAHLQMYLIDETYRAFARLTGLPERSSDAVEDLHDLQRIDPAIADLSERMAALEQSQDNARAAWRTLRVDMQALAARLQALEQQTSGTISRIQRGTIYQMVQAWADALVANDPRLSPGGARAACWATLKRRFNLARYEDLPAAQYAACVTFLRESYRTATGRDLDLPEQTELDLS